MKSSLFLATIISLNSFAAQLNCDELSKSVDRLEKARVKSVINGDKCKDLKPLTDFDETSKKIFNEYKCSMLSNIDARIEQLQNQNTVLAGFEKLKLDLKEEKEKTATQDIKDATKSAENFINALNTAQSLELLLDSVNEKNEPLIFDLKKIPIEKRKNPNEFKKFIADLCKNKKDKTKIDICHPNFNPSDITLTEINTLLEKDISKEMIELWKKSLDIKKKDNSKYSFNEMQEDLKETVPRLIDSEKLHLSKKELLAINSLPDFKNDNNLSFLKNLTILKDENKTKLRIINAQNQVSDLYERSAFEFEVNIYTGALGILSKINDPKAKESCEKSKINYSAAQDCLTELRKMADSNTLKGQELADFELFIKSQNLSKDYLSKLSKVNSCIEKDFKNKTNIQESKCFDEINSNQLSIASELKALNELKKLSNEESATQNLMLNYAKNKLFTEKCPATLNSSEVEICESPLQQVTPAIITLSNDIIDIPVHLLKTENPIDISEICNGELKNSDYKKICEIQDEAEEENTPDKEAASRKRRLSQRMAESYIGPVDPGSRNESSTTSDLIGAGVNLLRSTLNAFNQPLYQPPPYAPQYNNSAGATSISDRFLGSAYYQGGLGIYATTPGTVPYSSFGTYTPYRTNSPSLYFR